MTGAGASGYILEAEGLRKARFDEDRRFEVALPELYLHPGDRVALVGPSGSGKSTILALLAMATNPDDGLAFRLVGHDVLNAWHSNDQSLLSLLRAQSATYLPQRDGLLEFLTIRENILCSAELADALPVQEIDLLVEMLDLGEVLDAMPAGLSGGQRQRAAVACALAQRPALILADEPTAALDAKNASRVMDSLIALADRSGAAIVLATHQLHLVEAYQFREIMVTETGEKSNRTSVFEAA